MFKKLIVLVVACSIFILPADAAPADIGKIISVDPGATLIHLQQSATLTAGAGVATGDVITTDRRGQVQLLFNDETRVAIGPNSRFVVENVTLNSGGTAKQFAVSAVAGTFRFITGRSRKSVYAVNTPTATMGIRGTVFDFVSRERLGTDLIIFSGEVRMCGRGGNCFEVAGACAAVQMDAGGNFNTVKTKAGKRDLIGQGFSFVSDQKQLQPEFRTTVRSCGRDVISQIPPDEGDHSVRQSDPTPTPPEPPAPEPPEPPREPERPDPPRDPER